MDIRALLRERFDRSDLAIHAGKGYSQFTNENGDLAWGEAYILMAYMEMYRATRDSHYLHQLVAHFDRVLANRDDKRGVADAYAGKPLAGWGATKYTRGAWHVWIVHTGMITLGPAEFVRLVEADRWLQKEFATKAQQYRLHIEQCIQDTEPYWRNGPGADEGYYYSPHLKDALPLNQQNAMGSVLVEMWRATGSRLYRDRAQRLAYFFRNRLRTSDPRLYDWAYWYRLNGDGRGSEDISHASLNVDFAVRCIVDGLVFTRRDAQRFANTWLLKVRRSDGTWAGEVGGEEDGSEYMPGAGGMWLGLCRVLPRPQAQALYRDVQTAFARKTSLTAVEMVGVARLLRYAFLG
ncbi:MAG: hypothetical protein RMM08_02410 [Armatimonadota bacterium]|nr:hypothetical protein [bacterium]MDW8320193.1 hypothetical protein [Armatimonadota bacterium]